MSEATPPQNPGFDDLLDSALNDRAGAEPLAGLDARVLARISGGAQTSSSNAVLPSYQFGSGGWRWPAFAFASLALCIAAVVAHRHSSAITPRPKTASIAPYANGPRQTSAFSEWPDSTTRFALGRNHSTTNHRAITRASFSRPQTETDTSPPELRHNRSERLLPRLDTFPSRSPEQPSAIASRPDLVTNHRDLNPDSELDIARLQIAPILTSRLSSVQEQP